jgi:hypothetical protein
MLLQTLTCIKRDRQGMAGGVSSLPRSRRKHSGKTQSGFGIDAGKSGVVVAVKKAL